MMRLLRFLLAVLFVGSAMMLPDHGWSRPRAGGRTGKPRVTKPVQPKYVSSRTAVQSARRRYRGKVLSTTLQKPEKGRAYYRVKIVKDGKVRIFRVDAQNGKVRE